MSIFDSWIEIHDGSITKALKHLNEQLGTAHKHSNFSRWRLGALPNTKTLAFIYDETLAYLLQKYEVSSGLQTLITSELQIPANKPQPQ